MNDELGEAALRQDFNQNAIDQLVRERDTAIRERDDARDACKEWNTNWGKEAQKRDAAETSRDESARVAKVCCDKLGEAIIARDEAKELLREARDGIESVASFFDECDAVELRNAARDLLAKIDDTLEDE